MVQANAQGTTPEADSTVKTCKDKKCSIVGMCNTKRYSTNSVVHVMHLIVAQLPSQCWRMLELKEGCHVWICKHQLWNVESQPPECQESMRMWRTSPELLNSDEECNVDIEPVQSCSIFNALPFTS